jgi:hypothetical protein
VDHLNKECHLNKDQDNKAKKPIDFEKNMTNGIIEQIRLRFDYLCHYNGYGTYDDYIHQKVDIYEMSTFSKLDSGLPVNLWLDTASNYINGGHWKRIKFQLNYGNNIQNDNLGVMTISDDPQIIINNKQKVEVSNKDIETIRQFVIKYKDYLSSLSDQKITYKQFLYKYDFDKGNPIPNMNTINEMNYIFSH